MLIVYYKNQTTHVIEKMNTLEETLPNVLCRRMYDYVIDSGFIEHLKNFCCSGDDTPLHTYPRRGRLELLLTRDDDYIEDRSSVIQIPLGLHTKKYIIESEKANVIKNFLRIIVSKNLANKLRSEPDNLFCNKFSERRKRILNGLLASRRRKLLSV